MGFPRVPAVLLVLAGCGSDHRNYMMIDAPGPDAARFDAAHVDAPLDARIDAPPDGPPVPSHLLITQVRLGSDDAEFIDLFNPTTNAIALSGYYLSDDGEYWKTPLGSAGYAVGSGNFVVQFTGSGSDGSIASGQVMTVALATAHDFELFTTVTPTFSIADGSVVSVFGGGSDATLDTAGTAIALFAWDGSAAVVQDVDLMTVGQPGAGHAFVPKNVAQGYKTDANTLPMQATTPDNGNSTKRILLEASHEIENGQGNGITGHDETSEDTTLTWDGSGFTGPKPGKVPPQLEP
jgi:hypothetical protein